MLLQNLSVSSAVAVVVNVGCACRGGGNVPVVDIHDVFNVAVVVAILFV